ncbi:DUF3800 domain-containing protein [Candidatus Nomurabacteria bacterium]|nr:DUF3800 domain-containing protein [Candidatus Nomurabacteria bacterium]
MVKKIQPQFQEHYRLYIDELGTASPKDITSTVYILSGCSINKKDCENFKTRADQIKFKYWGRTNIVFHSREIGRKENDFAIFKDDKIFKEFILDLENFISNSKIKMFFIIVDKAKATAAGWDDIKVYKDTADSLIRNFLLILLTNDSMGEIIIESSSVSKDVHFLNSLNFFLGDGLKNLGVGHEKVQDTLTSVSFVTKKNHDTEEQVADLLAYAAKIKYQSSVGNKTHQNDYEKTIVSLLNKKIFKTPKDACSTKAKLFKEVKSFLVLP